MSPEEKKKLSGEMYDRGSIDTLRIIVKGLKKAEAKAVQAGLSLTIKDAIELVEEVKNLKETGEANA